MLSGEWGVSILGGSDASVINIGGQWGGGGNVGSGSGKLALREAVSPGGNSASAMILDQPRELEAREGHIKTHCKKEREDSLL